MWFTNVDFIISFSEKYETGKTSSNSHSDMTNSLGMLAYGSILNWNAQGVGEEEEDEETQRKIPMNSKNNDPSSSDSSSKPIRMTINQGNSKKKVKQKFIFGHNHV